MQSGNNSFDNNYFYNPLNSLSIDGEEPSIYQSNGQQLINQNPPVLGKRTETMKVEESMEFSNKVKPVPGLSSMKSIPNQSQKQIKSPGQVVTQQSNKIIEEEPQSKPTSLTKQISFQVDKQEKVENAQNMSKFNYTHQERVKAQPTSLANSEVNSTDRKRKRIFEKIEEKQEDEILNNNLLAMSQHTQETKEINSVEEYLRQKQLFLVTTKSKK